MPPSTAAQNALRPSCDRHRGEGRTDDESQRDDAVRVDPHQTRDLGVLRGRPHRGSEPRAIHQRREARHHRKRDRQNGDLHAGDGGSGDGVGLHLDDLRKGERVAAPDHHRHVLQDDRYADRRNQGCKPRRAAQRPVRRPLHRVADQHAHRDRATGGGEHNRERRQTRGRQRADHRERHHCAEHHHFAVREVDELDDAVDHRIAERDHGIDRPQRQAVDHLLDENVHATARLSETHPQPRFFPGDREQQKRHPRVPFFASPFKRAYRFVPSPTWVPQPGRQSPRT